MKEIKFSFMMIYTANEMGRDTSVNLARVTLQKERKHTWAIYSL